MFPRFTPSKRTQLFMIATAAAVLAAGCAPQKFKSRLPDYQAIAHFMGTGEPQPVAGTNIRGSVKFIQNDGVITAKGEITGLKPDSTVGFQVHEKENCMNMDASDAGPRFIPGGDPQRAGNLPPLKADASGKAVVDFSTQAFSLDKNADNGVVNRAIIVHESADPAAQPADKPSKRLACGVIRLQ